MLRKELEDKLGGPTGWFDGSSRIAGVCCGQHDDLGKIMGFFEKGDEVERVRGPAADMRLLRDGLFC